eukprot:6248218-Alexandrium_andersonii.AAC.1
MPGERLWSMTATAEAGRPANAPAAGGGAARGRRLFLAGPQPASEPPCHYTAGRELCTDASGGSCSSTAGAAL